MLTAILVLCLMVSLAALKVSVSRNIEYMDKLDEIEESLTVAIDTLKEQHERIDQKTKIEVFSDEPVVKELIRDIVIARNAVLMTAKILDDSLVIESPPAVEE